MYEPFGAAAQDLDAPISLHIDTNRPAPYVVAESNRTSRAALLATADYWVRVALGHLVLEGVFERYPRLRVGSAEHELKQVEAIIGSMTNEERRNHLILNGSRRKRIALGSGTNVAEVNKFLKQYQQAKKMMKSLSRGGGKGILAQLQGGR